MRNSDQMTDGCCSENKIRLRPHHFLCLRFWAGNGYSREYTDYVEKILPAIKKGESLNVEFGPDSLCEKCPHLKNGICDSQDRVVEFDRKVIELCSLKNGQETNWGKMFQSVSCNIMDQGKFDSICGDCAWAEICHK